MRLTLAQTPHFQFKTRIPRGCLILPYKVARKIVENCQTFKAQILYMASDRTILLLNLKKPENFRLFCGALISPPFLRASAMLKHVIAIGLTSVCPSVRLSVCPSVCPPHAGTLSKRLNILSCFLHHTIAHSF